MISRSRVQLAVAALAVAAGIAATAIAVTSDWADISPLEALLGLLVGWSFVATGLVAARRPDQERFGVLMAAVGFAWFASMLEDANTAFLFTLGLLLVPLYIGFFVHALLAFPSGKLDSRLARFVVVGAYLDVTVVQLLLLLFHNPTTAHDCPCPENLLAVTDNDRAYDAILFLQQPVAGIVLCSLGILVLARRWRAATPPLRRALGPVFVTGAVFISLVVLEVVAALVSDPAADVLELVALFAAASVPLAFLVGILRARLARAAVGELVVELGEAAPAEDVRERALRRALGDPSLVLAYWNEARSRFVDVAGRPVELPKDGTGRTATIVEREGDVVAALVHDESLRDNRDLLEAVAAAVGLALVNERRLAALAQAEAKNRALLDAMPDLMFRMSRDGVYLDVKGDESDLAAPAAELLGANVYDVLPRKTADRIMRCARNALDRRSVETVDYQLVIGGRLRDFEARMAPSGDDEVLLIVRDFTERRRTERELRRLQDELERRLDELRASRARIVEAGDAERRRLERNLHDGAQQRFVSLSLALRLAEARLRDDPEEAARLLSAAIQELEEGLEELRDFARGIHPAVLTDRGLQPALESLAARAPFPVDLATALDGRLPPPVEAAAYYVVAEALANAAKYAHASSASVRVAQDDGRAVVEVADDGIGGADPGRGSGLRGLADRIEALDGRLDVESRPGSGTTLRAEIPCE